MYDNDKDQTIVLQHATVIAVALWHAITRCRPARETDRLATQLNSLASNSEDCSSVVESIILMVRFTNGNGASHLRATCLRARRPARKASGTVGRSTAFIPAGRAQLAHSKKSGG